MWTSVTAAEEPQLDLDDQVDFKCTITFTYKGTRRYYLFATEVKEDGTGVVPTDDEMAAIDLNQFESDHESILGLMGDSDNLSIIVEKV